MRSEGLRIWMRNVLTLAPDEAELQLIFVLEQMQQLLLQWGQDEYRNAPRPIMILRAVSWEARVEELSERQRIGFGLWSKYDRQAIERLRLTQDMRRTRNGSVAYGPLRVEKDTPEEVEEEWRPPWCR